ncbi:MAG TPA: hypothetical protein VF846_16810 [Thermoanaerobaculia bacterium]
MGRTIFGFPVIDRHAVKFTSELALHFDILNETAWLEVTQNLSQ